MSPDQYLDDKKYENNLKEKAFGDKYIKFSEKVKAFKDLQEYEKASQKERSYIRNSRNIEQRLQELEGKDRNYFIRRNNNIFFYRGNTITGLNVGTKKFIVFNYLYEQSIKTPGSIVFLADIENELRKSKKLVTKKTVSNTIEDIRKLIKVNGKPNTELSKLIETNKGYRLNNPIT